jgi:hypothetical protein
LVVQRQDTSWKIQPKIQPEKQVIDRAYELWEQAGKPEGRDQEFYDQAERRLHADEEPKETPDDI